MPPKSSIDLCILPMLRLFPKIHIESMTEIDDVVPATATKIGARKFFSLIFMNSATFFNVIKIASLVQSSIESKLQEVNCKILMINSFSVFNEKNYPP